MSVSTTIDFVLTDNQFSFILNRVLSGEVNATQIVQFGHGLFYNRNEVTQEHLGEMAERNNWIMIATGEELINACFIFYKLIKGNLLLL